MKKILGIITVILLMLFLTACDSGNGSTRTFKLEKDGITTTMVYTYENDKVIKQTTENLIVYDLVGITSKEHAQVIFDPMSEEFQNYDGVMHEMQYEDDQAIEKLELDYDVVNFEEIMHLPGMNFDENVEEKGVSMVKSAEYLESKGFKEVK